jgi:glycolate oxidase iron-sulfur subunit
LGCATELGMPRVTLALGRLLKALDIEATLVSAACCGLPAYTWGDLAGARLAGRSLISALTAQTRLEALQAIITPCASCASYLHEYDELFADEPDAAAAAARVAATAMPASLFLAGAGLPELLRDSGEPLGKHTFHDPCHLAHYYGGREKVRDVLRALPGGGFTEMAGADSCCGAGGSYVMTHPAHADAVLERKIDAIRMTGAELVTTACPGCLLQLERGLKGVSGVRAMHLLEAAWTSLAASRAGTAERL